MSLLPANLASLPRGLGHRPAAAGPTQAERARGRRITILLVAIVVMSIGDLSMTLTHLTHAGMLEANPLARLVMAYNSPALLAAWKLTSVGLAIAILYWARHRGRTEIATWFCFLVLTWLTCRWFVYNEQIILLVEVPAAFVGHPQSDWVAMTPE